MSKKDWWIQGEYTAEDLGGIIKAIREDYLKISQEAVAEAIGVKLNTYVSSENGKGNHIDNVLRRICHTYEMKTLVHIKTK